MARKETTSAAVRRTTADDGPGYGGTGVGMFPAFNSNVGQPMAPCAIPTL